MDNEDHNDNDKPIPKMLRADEALKRCLTTRSQMCKDLSRIKAGFISFPPQLYFEYRATFWHWLALLIQNKVEEECL